MEGDPGGGGTAEGNQAPGVEWHGRGEGMQSPGELFDTLLGGMHNPQQYGEQPGGMPRPPAAVALQALTRRGPLGAGRAMLSSGPLPETFASQALERRISQAEGLLFRAQLAQHRRSSENDSWQPEGLRFDSFTSHRSHDPNKRESCTDSSADAMESLLHGMPARRTSSATTGLMSALAGGHGGLLSLSSTNMHRLGSFTSAAPHGFRAPPPPLQINSPAGMPANMQREGLSSMPMHQLDQGPQGMGLQQLQQQQYGLMSGNEGMQSTHMSSLRPQQQTQQQQQQLIEMQQQQHQQQQQQQIYSGHMGYGSGIAPGPGMQERMSDAGASALAPMGHQPDMRPSSAGGARSSGGGALPNSSGRLTMPPLSPGQDAPPLPMEQQPMGGPSRLREMQMQVMHRASTPGSGSPGGGFSMGGMGMGPGMQQQGVQQQLQQQESDPSMAALTTQQQLQQQQQQQQHHFNQQQQHMEGGPGGPDGTGMFQQSRMQLLQQQQLFPMGPNSPRGGAGAESLGAGPGGFGSSRLSLMGTASQQSLQQQQILLQGHGGLGGSMLDQGIPSGDLQLLSTTRMHSFPGGPVSAMPDIATGRSQAGLGGSEALGQGHVGERHAMVASAFLHCSEHGGGLFDGGSGQGRMAMGDEQPSPRMTLMAAIHAGQQHRSASLEALQLSQQQQVQGMTRQGAGGGIEIEDMYQLGRPPSLNMGLGPGMGSGAMGGGGGFGSGVLLSTGVSEGPQAQRSPRLVVGSGALQEPSSPSARATHAAAQRQQPGSMQQQQQQGGGFSESEREYMLLHQQRQLQQQQHAQAQQLSGSPQLTGQQRPQSSFLPVGLARLEQGTPFGSQSGLQLLQQQQRLTGSPGLQLQQSGSGSQGMHRQHNEQGPVPTPGGRQQQVPGQQQQQSFEKTLSQQQQAQRGPEVGVFMPFGAQVQMEEQQEQPQEHRRKHGLQSLEGLGLPSIAVQRDSAGPPQPLLQAMQQQQAGQLNASAGARVWQSVRLSQHELEQQQQLPELHEGGASQLHGMPSIGEGYGLPAIPRRGDAAAAAAARQMRQQKRRRTSISQHGTGLRTSVSGTSTDAPGRSGSGTLPASVVPSPASARVSFGGAATATATTTTVGTVGIGSAGGSGALLGPRDSTGTRGPGPAAPGRQRRTTSISGVGKAFGNPTSSSAHARAFDDSDTAGTVSHGGGDAGMPYSDDELTRDTAGGGAATLGHRATSVLTGGGGPATTVTTQGGGGETVLTGEGSDDDGGAGGAEGQRRSMTAEERMMRNREAAAKSRARRDQYQNSLQEHILKLQQHSMALQHLLEQHNVMLPEQLRAAAAQLVSGLPPQPPRPPPINRKGVGGRPRKNPPKAEAVKGERGGASMPPPGRGKRRASLSNVSGATAADLEAPGEGAAAGQEGPEADPALGGGRNVRGRGGTGRRSGEGQGGEAAGGEGAEQGLRVAGAGAAEGQGAM